MTRKVKTDLERRIPEFDFSYLPVIKNAAAMGLDAAGIGLILGYAGKNPEKWLKKLQQQYPDVKTAYEAGVNIADTHLVSTAMQVACGYKFEEEVIKYILTPDGMDENHRPKLKSVPVERKINKKYQHPDNQMLKFLLINRLPEFFMNQRSSSKPDEEEPVDDGSVTEKEMQKVFGSLITLAKKLKKNTKEVNSEILEIENENDTK